jgi:streptogramin lyase
VASDANGNVYVADTGSDRIQEFGVDGRYRGEWGRLGTTGYPAASTRVGGFRDPAGVAVGADGTVYVADTGNNRLQARDPLSGTWRVLPGPTLRGPRGVAVDGSGRLYVADTGADLVRMLDPATGQWSTLDRDFSAPRAVAVGASGDVYVADTGADRVQVRNARAGSWTVIGTDELRRPSGLAAQGTGIVVADTGHDRLIRLGPHGKPTDVWGARGVGAGEFDGPQGVAVDATGRVLVADQFNNRVQIFEPGPASQQTQAPAPPARPQVAPGPEPAPGASGRPEPLTVTVSRLDGVRTLRRTGLRLELACSHACLVSARLMTTARAARRLGLSRSGRPLTVAARRVLLADARPRRMHLRLRPRAARAAGRLPLVLVVSAVDTAGARTQLQRRL